MRKVKVEAPFGPQLARVTDAETGEKIALAKSLEIRFCADSRKLLGKLTTFVKDDSNPGEGAKFKIVERHETVEVVSIDMEEVE